MEEYLVDEKSSQRNFDALSFERKIVELVEELRLRRNIEIENEKNLKICMEEKYNLEIELDERQRRHVAEKESLEQQISVLKRKLEDNVCVSDDEKARQQIMNKTYSQEVRALKEELRKAGSERLNLTKKIQALESQLKLHTNYQDSILKQIGEIRKRLKNMADEHEKLKSAQKMAVDNIDETKVEFRKFDQSHKHLMECIAISENLNKDLKKELVSCRSELTISKNSTSIPPKENKSRSDLEKSQKRNFELEKLFLQSRKENEKTLMNLEESNNRLCSFIKKYSELRETEKTLCVKIESYEKDMEVLQNKLEDQSRELEDLRSKFTYKQAVKEFKEAPTQTSSELKADKKSQANTLTSNNDDKCIPENEKLDILPFLNNNLDRNVLNEQPNETNEIFKRKRCVTFTVDADTYLQPLKKPCSERSFVNQNHPEQENDLSLPSSMESSQNSVICCDDNIDNTEKFKNGENFPEVVLINEAEAKELMSVEKNLKNLQVFDSEITMTAVSKGENHKEELNTEASNQ